MVFVKMTFMSLVCAGAGTAFSEGPLFCCPLTGVDFWVLLKAAGFTVCCLTKVKFTGLWLVVCCSCLWLK